MNFFHTGCFKNKTRYRENTFSLFIWQRVRSKVALVRSELVLSIKTPPMSQNAGPTGPAYSSSFLPTGAHFCIRGHRWNTPKTSNELWWLATTMQARSSSRCSRPLMWYRSPISQATERHIAAGSLNLHRQINEIGKLPVKWLEVLLTFRFSTEHLVNFGENFDFYLFISEFAVIC